MALETKVKVAGDWKLLTEPKVKVAGDWKVVEQIQVRVGGAWKTVFEIVGGTVPNVTPIEILWTGTLGGTFAGIIFHDYRTGSGSNDGRILTKKHYDGTAGYDYSDMGNDDQPVDHTGEWTSDTVTESEWEVANTVISSGSFSQAHAAVGIYTALNVQDMLWSKKRLGGKGRTPGTSIVNATFRIREVADPSNYDDFTVKLTAIQT